MIEDRAGDRVAGLSTRLFVLFLAMVIAGFVIPSPGISLADPKLGTGSLYEPLAAPAKPTRLIVPDIALRAPIIPIEVRPDGVLKPPTDVDEVGWWRRSARPGSTSGQTLVTGHTVHSGEGVMNRLGEVRPGALIQIETPRGTVDYRATKIFVYTRAELAEHARKLFGQHRNDGRLVLVTCTAWNGTEYESNIIVFADQLGVRTGTTAQRPDQAA